MSSADSKRGPGRPRRGCASQGRKRSRTNQSPELQGEGISGTNSLDEVHEAEAPLSSKRANTQLECSVCLDACVQPTELPCSHIFCFLCVKGASFQSRQCPLCRAAIPWGFFRRPKLVPVDSEENEQRDEGYSWFYQGNQGWWQYDTKTGEQLEARYNDGEKQFSVLIAGASYTVDLSRMIQYPTSRPGRTRKIKRDASTADKLGIAGIAVC